MTSHVNPLGAKRLAAAGTCRRLRLNLGEGNPDGTPHYRTADFQCTR
ncbi:MAG: hypothetical protein H0U52_18265 [Chloroflexi bacterium]|nr:hypothetical protein [Chloroflexota bacterium]